jgi:hypothetical protein
MAPDCGFRTRERAAALVSGVGLDYAGQWETLLFSSFTMVLIRVQGAWEFPLPGVFSWGRTLTRSISVCQECL